MDRITAVVKLKRDSLWRCDSALRALGLIAAVILLFLTVFSAQAFAGNIDPEHKWAWGENIGWMELEFNPSSAAVMVRDEYLEGYILTANIGWINVGHGDGPYDNTGPEDYGVNNSYGYLSGYGWSENAGWIDFNPAGSQVVIDS
jgi:hypothetical protein